MKNRENIEKTLNDLNTYSCHPRRKLLLRNMETNKKYRILSAQKTIKLNKSKKSVIKLEVDNAYIYLPERFKKLSESVWDVLNNGHFQISNFGQHEKTNNLTFSCDNALEAEQTHHFDFVDYINNFSYSPSYSNNDSTNKFRNSIDEVNEFSANVQ